VSAAGHATCKRRLPSGTSSAGLERCTIGLAGEVAERAEDLPVEAIPGKVELVDTADGIGPASWFMP
jgi:hypothetical protein